MYYKTFFLPSQDFDLPLMAFGEGLTCLDLRNVCHFQSGTALHIRRHCPNLVRLTLEIESTDAASSSSNAGGGGGGGGGGADGQAGEQSVWALQNQVIVVLLKLFFFFCYC